VHRGVWTRENGQDESGGVNSRVWPAPAVSTQARGRARLHKQETPGGALELRRRKARRQRCPRARGGGGPRGLGRMASS
jgi:hypothetical protein